MRRAASLTQYQSRRNLRYLEQQQQQCLLRQSIDLPLRNKYPKFSSQLQYFQHTIIRVMRLVALLAACKLCRNWFTLRGRKAELQAFVRDSVGTCISRKGALYIRRIQGELRRSTIRLLHLHFAQHQRRPLLNTCRSLSLLECPSETLESYAEAGTSSYRLLHRLECSFVQLALADSPSVQATTRCLEWICQIAMNATNKCNIRPRLRIHKLDRNALPLILSRSNMSPSRIRRSTT